MPRGKDFSYEDSPKEACKQQITRVANSAKNARNKAPLKIITIVLSSEHNEALVLANGPMNEDDLTEAQVLLNQHSPKRKTGIPSRKKFVTRSFPIDQDFRILKKT